MELTRDIIGKRAMSTKHKVVNGKVLGIDGAYAIVEYLYTDRSTGLRETRVGRSFVYEDDLVMVEPFSLQTPAKES